MSRSLLAPPRRDAAILLGLTAILFAAWRQVAIPPAAPSCSRATDFCVERAMAHVRAIARAPHPTGSPELARVRRYILDQLETLHLRAETLTTTAVGTRYAVAGTVTNILTRLPGREQGKSAVLLVAHYDGVAAGPAAGDDGSGVAIVLETLRALEAGPPPPRDIVALLSDGEEAALLGAAAFAEQTQRVGGNAIGVVVNLEARGSSGRSLMFETSPGDLALVRGFAHAVPQATGTSFLASLYRILPNDTDFSELSRIGLPGLNFAFIGDVLNYHTPQDDPDHLDPASLGHQGVAALALARHFSGTGRPAANHRDATYFHFPMLGMVVYPSSWARPLAALAVLVLVAALVTSLIRRRLRIRDPVLGLAGFLTTAVTAAGVCVLVWLGVTKLHRGWSHGGYPQWSATYLAALLLIATTVTLAAARLFRRWVRPPGSTTGALVVWAGAAIASAWLLPGGSYVFTWPALLAGLAIGIETVFPDPWHARLASRTGALLAGAVSSVFVTTIIWLVLQGLGLAMPTVAAIAFLTVLVLWPVVEWVCVLGTRRWRMWVGVSGVAGCALVALGMLTVRNDRRRPIRDIVVYSFDADAGRARWYASGRSVDAYTREFVGTAPGRLMPSALELLSVALRGASSGALAAPAPVTTLPPPRVRVVTDSLHAAGRTLVLRVTSERRGSEILMRIADVAVRAASVNGRPITTEWRRRSTHGWRLTYVNPGPEGILLRLELVSSEPLEFEVADQSVGLPALENHRAEARPPGVEPIQMPDATLILRRYRI